MVRKVQGGISVSAIFIMGQLIPQKIVIPIMSKYPDAAGRFLAVVIFSEGLFMTL
jgi:hypothetical protein